jgi:hypothetical protein
MIFPKNIEVICGIKKNKINYIDGKIIIFEVKKIQN